MKKKLSAILLITAVAVACTACGSNNNKQEDTTIPSEQAVTEGSGNMGSVTSDQLESFDSTTTEKTDTDKDTDNADEGTQAEPEANTGTLSPSEDSESSGSLSSNGFTLTFGDYTVTVLSCEEVLDVNDCHSLRVEYAFTNNSDSQATFSTSILTTASQGEYRLANTSPADADTEYSAQLKFVQPGESVNCATYYLLNDSSTDVIINIANMLSSTDNMSLTYSFDNGEE